MLVVQYNLCEDKKPFGPTKLGKFFLSEWPLLLFAARTRVELGTWIILTRVGFHYFC